MNRKMTNTISFRVDLIRFRKDNSVCTTVRCSDSLENDSFKIVIDTFSQVFPMVSIFEDVNNMFERVILDKINCDKQII